MSNKSKAQEQELEAVPATELDKMIQRSDARIAKARNVLAGSTRGAGVLQELRRFMQGPASGLDHQGMMAVRDLVEEFCINSRRGF